ncbi:uncharacterized protein SOCE26_100380 [Sorangium cellulosum]|uniref:Uncharacterized protein n=1 Tax=Sorangium cellulosum TaxID=56 RepID=A0A2L0FAA1_SORCE|nr:hypothetical protein [Sorangium cellulosum]AUX48500.1 uncharacterized protein SOCE26_100380 [Sorangium cellulosum]
MKLNLASLAASTVAFMSTFTMGCGADCESACEKAREAGCGFTRREVLDPNQPPPARDCAGMCGNMEKESEAAGCTSEFDEYIGCINDQRSVCEANACSSEATRHMACMIGY